MAKKSKIVKSRKLNLLIASSSEKISNLKDLSLSGDIDAMIKLSKIKNSSSVRRKNRCSITNRPRGFVGYFGVSRIVLRDLASSNFIPGLYKN